MSDSGKADTAQGRRFVVLKHTDEHGVHFDLMIEQDRHLATWSFPRPPAESGSGGADCRRIADHRLHYLDYEGPLSDGRGSVQRYDQGLCQVHTSCPQRWEVTFQGRHLAGPYVLERRQVGGNGGQHIEKNHRRDAGATRSDAVADTRDQSWSLRAQ